MQSKFEWVDVACTDKCGAVRTIGKHVEDDLPDWTCGPCKREAAIGETESSDQSS